MLSLAFKPGEDFFVGDQRFVVSKVVGPDKYSITRERDGIVFEIIDDGIGAEIMPSVRITVGTRGQGNLARIAFDAPASIRVLRGEKYHTASGHADMPRLLPKDSTSPASKAPLNYVPNSMRGEAGDIEMLGEVVHDGTEDEAKARENR